MLKILQDFYRCFGALTLLFGTSLFAITEGEIRVWLQSRTCFLAGAYFFEGQEFCCFESLVAHCIEEEIFGACDRVKLREKFKASLNRKDCVPLRGSLIEWDCDQVHYFCYKLSDGTREQLCCIDAAVTLCVLDKAAPGF